MKELLWTAYLAVMLFMSILSIDSFIELIKYRTVKEANQFNYMFRLLILLISCIMLAIWYMYFLH